MAKNGSVITKYRVLLFYMKLEKFSETNAFFLMVVPYDNSGYSNYFLTPTISSVKLFFIPVGR